MSDDVQFRPFIPGKGLSAGHLNAIDRAALHARGTNGVTTRYDATGRLIVEGTSSTAAHPFKIRVGYTRGAGGAITAVLASVLYGTIQGTDDGSYAGVPSFHGISGDYLTTPPTVFHDLGTAAGTYSLYAVVTVNKDGEISDSWLEFDPASVVDDPFVPDDFPDPGDTGTDGTYYHLIGSVTIDANKRGTVAQGVTSSLLFKLCGSEGGWYAA